MGPLEVREILVGTDFSEASREAVRLAHGYARVFHARLHVLHVAPPEDRAPAGLLTELGAALGTDVAVETAVVRGQAADEIVRYARAHAIDLIVLGTHGRTGASPALMGSVAERVVRTAPCPVLTVPPPAGERTARVLPPSVHRCIVCQTLAPDLVCEPCRTRIRGQDRYATRGRGAGPHRTRAS